MNQTWEEHKDICIGSILSVIVVIISLLGSILQWPYWYEKDLDPAKN